jgi:hypothetical protein
MALADQGGGAMRSRTRPRLPRRVAFVSSIAVALALAAESPAFAVQTLTVTKAGTGTGTVTSDPPGISCGTDCSEVYADGTVVTLTAWLTRDPTSLALAAQAARVRGLAP